MVTNVETGGESCNFTPTVVCQKLVFVSMYFFLTPTEYSALLLGVFLLIAALTALFFNIA